MEQHHNTLFTVEPSFFILLALSLVIIPAQWVLGWLFATCVHELSHYLSIKLFRLRIFQVRIGKTGILMETETMKAHQELFCALAGPIGALSILPFAKVIPHAAVCAAVQSCFNMLPFFPMDGGRAILSILHIIGVRVYACFDLWNTALFLITVAITVSLCLLTDLPWLCLVIEYALFRRSKWKNSLQSRGFNSRISTSKDERVGYK